MKRSLIILVIVLLPLIILGLIVFKSDKPEILKKPTLYTLYKPLNIDFPNKHPELRELQQVSIWLDEEKLVTKIYESLNKDSFIKLIDELVENGYINARRLNHRTELKEREIKEESNNIVIVDKGLISVLNDVPPYQTTYYIIILKYRYDNNTGNIYFKSQILDYK